MNSSIKFFIVCSACALLTPWHTAWSHSKQVPRPTQAGTHVVRMANDQQGNTIAVWCQDTVDGKYAIYGSLYQNGTWNTADKLSPDYAIDIKLAKPISPQVCCDASLHAIVIWAAINEQSQPVLYATAYIPGTGPTKIDIITVGTKYIYFPSLCCNAGKALMVWQQEDPEGHEAIYKAVYAPNQAVSITGPEKVYASDGTTHIMNPHVRCDATGKATVVWREGKINQQGAHVFNPQAMHNLKPHGLPNGNGFHTATINW